MDASRSRGRITVVTNGNYFASLALGPLLDGDQELQVIVTSGLRKQKGNRLVEAWHLLRRWGPRYFAYKLTTYVLPALAEKLKREPRTVAAACRVRGLEVITARNVNRRDVRDRIAAFAPDLLLSVSCPYRIKAAVLELPRLGSLNLHSSLLPAYAGVCTYIHVLAAGERRSGITLHEMVEKFDAGRIVAQSALDIEPGTSVAGLFADLCRRAGPMVAESVREIIERGSIEGRSQPADLRTYFGEPTRADIRALRGHGFVLMRAADARVIWNQDPTASDA